MSPSLNDRRHKCLGRAHRGGTTRQLTHRKNIVAGIESAPAAFAGLFAGENIGKQLVRVSSEEVSVVETVWPILSARASPDQHARPPTASGADLTSALSNCLFTKGWA